MLVEGPSALSHCVSFTACDALFSDLAHTVEFVTQTLIIVQGKD